MQSILIVEDHLTFASTVAEFLEDRSEYEVAAVAHTATEAWDLLPLLTVDLALVDVSMTAMSGIDLVAKITAKYPDLICLMLSGHIEADYIRQALEAGARGYVRKGNPFQLLEAIESVLEGELYLSPNLRV